MELKNKEYERLDDETKIKLINREKANVKDINHEPTIGIIICKKR